MVATSAPPNSRPRSEGLIGVASTRISTSWSHMADRQPPCMVPMTVTSSSVTGISHTRRPDTSQRGRRKSAFLRPPEPPGHQRVSSTVDPHRGNQALLSPLRAALYDYDPMGVRAALRGGFAPDAAVHITHLFEDLDGPNGLYHAVLAPLAAAWPDLERRDYICIAGSDPSGHHWVGCAARHRYRSRCGRVPPASPDPVLASAARPSRRLRRLTWIED